MLFKEIKIKKLEEQIKTKIDKQQKKRFEHQLEWFNQTSRFLNTQITNSKECEIKPSCSKNKSSSVLIK